MYALLPLVTEWYGYEPAIPDYHSTVPHVYKNTVLKMIETTRPLYILIQGTNFQKAYPSLPSWIRDWSQTFTHLTLLHLNQQVALYKACGNEIAMPPQPVWETVLVLTGVLIDCVKDAGGLMFSSRPSNVSDFSENGMSLQILALWVTSYMQAMTVAALDVVPSGVLFARTLSMTRAKHPTTTSAELPQKTSMLMKLGVISQNLCHSKTSRLLLEPLTKLPIIGGIDYAIRTTTTHRRLFTTSKGCLGIGPHLRGHGWPLREEIFVLPGGQTPFLLRQAGERYVTGHGVQPCYHLVGGCYVPSI